MNGRASIPQRGSFGNAAVDHRYTGPNIDRPSITAYALADGHREAD